MVCSYIRLSEEDCKKDKEDLSQSIKNQISYIENFAKAKELSVDYNYIDDGYTGINYNRPAFEKLIQDIKLGKVNVIITKDFSRLGREYIETAYFITKFFPENNVRYIAINDNYDSNSKDGVYNDVLIGFKSIMNDRYIKDTSVRIKEIKRLKTEKGYYMGFIAPYGYIKEHTKNKITLKIDEESSKIVKRIFEEIALGISRKEVAEKLNKEHILTPIKYLKMTKSKGKKYYDVWTDKIIYRIIRNHVYTGDNIIRKSIKSNYKQKKRNYVAIRDREIMMNTHPAIVSQELFDKANSKIKQIKRKENRIKNYNSPLKEKVFCGECGKRLNITGRLRESGNIYYHFYCSNCNKTKNKCFNNKKISANILEKIVYDKIKTNIEKHSNKEEVIQKVYDNLYKKNNVNSKIKNIKIDIDNYNNKIRNLYIKKTREEISLEEFLIKKENENNRKKFLETELEELLKEKDVLIKKEELLKKYNEFLNKENIYKYAFQDLIKEVYFYKDRSIIIKFNFSILTKTVYKFD